MRVCDFIVRFLAKKNIGTVFMVSGGGMLHLSDGLAAQTAVKTVCCHHEQAAAMAAVAYGKYDGVGCAYFTTGCGGTNAMTGLLHAWQDNTPVLFFSGQVKTKETIRAKKMPLRQLGVQEADIVSLVSPITKYAAMPTDPGEIRYHLEKAYYLATTGRPGPCWLDIPSDVQSAIIDPDELPGYSPVSEDVVKTVPTEKELACLREALCQAKRPVIVAGQGVRLSGSSEQLLAFAERHAIPIVCSRMGLDSLPTAHPQVIGPIGNKGLRGSNFAVQNADLLLVLGSRMSVSSTGHEYELFAREARILVVDIDPIEHQKGTIRIDRVIAADVSETLSRLQIPATLSFFDWANRCNGYKQRYPACLPRHYESGRVNLYAFMRELSRQLPTRAAVVSDAGSAVFVPAQGLVTTSPCQRYITSGAQAEMGFTLPGTIGVWAAGAESVIGITGDGSLQMNLQELQTLVYHQCPVKLFVWNNEGYLSIRASQGKLFGGRRIGTDATNGVSFPNLSKLIPAYGLSYICIHGTSELETGIANVLSLPGPVVCEVLCEEKQEIEPSVGFRTLPDGLLRSSPLEDMSPFLERNEFLQNMLIASVEESVNAMDKGGKS